MEFTTLKQKISSIGPVELDEQYAQFRKRHGTTDLDRFLVHLHRSEIITDEEFRAIEARDSIELTGFDGLTGSGRRRATHHGGSEAGAWLPGYEALEQIGKGSMGSVLLAKDTDLRRKVAYKHVNEAIVSDRRLMERFCTEAQLTAQLEHPNIVPIYGLVVEEDGNIGYAMKLIHGKTLGDLVAETRRQLDETGRVDEFHSLPRLLEHFLKVCDAVHYANGKGVLHRDLKPQNIMVGTYNEVYVVDWGIAKLIGGGDEAVDPVGGEEGVEAPGWDVMERTRRGETPGTPMYMSPEQAAGGQDRLDCRSDLFTLGLILFELVTLRRPHTESDLDALLPSVRQARISPFVPYSRRLRVPVEIKAIVRRACALNPEDRYPDVAAFAAEVRRYLQGEAIQALPDTPVRRLMRWMGKNREKTLLVVAGLMLISVTVVSWSLYHRQQQVIEAQIREQKLAALLTAVARQAHSIDSLFLRFEAALEGLAFSTTYLLTRGEEEQGRYYTREDFADPRRRPDDFTFSAIYNQPLSVSWPLVKVAPDVTVTAVESLIRKLIPLRHYFRHMFAKGLAGGGEESIGKERQPLIWAYVGLEQGVLSVFPGTDGYPAAYDPRQRPWYRESLHNAGPQWITPYIDAGGLGWMLPCTTPFFAEDGRLLGVAGVEMGLGFVRNNLIKPPEMPGIEHSFLLDGRARIVAGSSDGHDEEYEAGTLVNTIADLPTYPHAEAVRSIREGESGQIKLEIGGTEKVITYYRIESIDWYLLVEADARRLLATGNRDPN